MNNHEASSSSDEEGDDAAMDEMCAGLLEAEGLTPGRQMEVDPEVQREQDIIAEVARRRAERDATVTKQKSDEIFQHFDVDGDSYLNYTELRKLGLATGGELPKPAYKSICEEIGANPAKGVTKELLLLMYTDAGLGDAHRDYNLIFARDS